MGMITFCFHKSESGYSSLLFEQGEVVDATCGNGDVRQVTKAFLDCFVSLCARVYDI
jgi:hypothetical protein